MSSTPAARPDSIRRHNLGVLLSQIHRDGQLTRAQLTQLLDLSRSTVGALVAELEVLGLIEEVVPTGGVGAGRPSHRVGPREDGPYAIAVDLDITHVTVAAVGLGGSVLARESVTTELDPPSVETVVARVRDLVADLRASIAPGAWPIGVGVSLPGTVSRDGQVVGFAPNLGWHDARFADALSEAVDGLPVIAGNDADLGVRAEHLRGSGRDSDELIYLVGRRGVGAGIMVNGAPLRGRDGHAGEVGHNVVDPSGPRCHCGKRGCIETVVGEKALLTYAGRRRTPTPERVAAVFTDAAEGHERALEAVRTVADRLGRTIASLVNVLNPGRVILGGTFAQVFALAGEQLRAGLGAASMERERAMPELVVAGLGDDSSLLGAAELAFDRVLADPLSAR